MSVKKQASAMNLVDSMGKNNTYEEIKQDHRNAEKKRDRVKTPIHGTKEKIKPDGVDDICNSEMIKTEIQVEDSESGITNGENQFKNSGKSIKEVDSEDRSLDYTSTITIDLERQSELRLY